MAHFLLRGRIACIRIANPPVNALGLAARKGIFDALDRAEESGAQAIVLTGDGSTFPAGADIAEFASGAAGNFPSLGDVIERISALNVHTISAIHGTALGGGLELSLGCHFRLMHDRARIGLPEVHLGILPGAGGTQRVPRLIGCEAAIAFMTRGAPIGAAKAVDHGLVDEVVSVDTKSGAALDDAMVEHGVEFATHLLETRGATVDASRVVAAKRVPPVSDGFFEGAREAVRKKAKGEVAPLAIVDAVAAAAAAASFEEGLAAEATLLGGLMAGTQARALQHVFFAERKIGKVDGLPKGLTPAPIRQVAVVGAGTMGGGIAMCFADRGVPVTLVDVSEQGLARGMEIIGANYRASAKKGKLSDAQVEERLARISPASRFDDAGVASADLVIEAAFETMSVKKQIFGELDGVCKPGAVLATNTSTLDVDEIASATSRPADVCGTHFFSPANVMPLLENVAGAATSDATVATVMALGKLLGKKAVLARNCFGFIGNRMLESYLREAMYMLEEGCMPADVDAPLRAFGMPMGPLQMSDLAGNDIGYNIRRDWKIEQAMGARGERYHGKLADAMHELGRHGQKAKKGWYDYSAGRAPVDDPGVAQLIVDHSAAEGIARRGFGADEVVDRCLLPLVNEGFKCIEEGIAQRESDVDIVYLYGYGFPRARGGPMHWARHGRDGGLPRLLDDLRRYGEAHPTVPHWAPSELLVSEAAKQAAASKL